MKLIEIDDITEVNWPVKSIQRDGIWIVFEQRHESWTKSAYKSNSF